MEEREKSFGVEMVGVVVAGGDDVDEVEFFGSDDAFGHADVGFVGIRVFFGE